MGSSTMERGAYQWTHKIMAKIAHFFAFFWRRIVFRSTIKQPVMDVKSIPAETSSLQTWMSNLPKELYSVPLTQLTIPGSHDSGSYALDIADGIAPDKPDLKESLWMKLLGLVFCYIIKRWSKTQHLSITDQLKGGIRYFDLRTAPKIDTDELYFVHGLYADKIMSICTEINEFLNQNPKEIVLIDFQHFYAMSELHHTLLIEGIYAVFKDKLCPFDPNQKCNDITLEWLWSKKYQVFVFYRDESIRCISNQLWPGCKLPNPWANTMDVKFLCDFLDKKTEKRCESCFYVTQCVLTPNDSFVLHHCFSTLYQQLVLKCNGAIFQWLERKWSCPKSPNIVMADFIEWNNFSIPKSVVQMNLSHPVLRK